MRRKPFQILVLVLVALLVVTAAGCGKKKTSTSTTTTTAATTTEATTTTSETTTAATTTTSGGGLGALAGSCSELSGLAQALATAMQGNSGDIEKVAAALQKFADGAPTEIREAFKTVANVFSKIADAVKGIKPGSVPDAATLAKLAQLQSLVTPAFTKALTDIETWAAANCHA